MFLSSPKMLVIGRVSRAHQRILGGGRDHFEGCIEQRVALPVQLRMESKLVRVLRLLQQWITMSDGNVRSICIGPFLGFHASGCK